MTEPTKKVAILATHGFEQSELISPKQFLEDNSYETEVISIEPGSIRGWKDGDWGDNVPVDRVVDSADPADYDALVLPGGVMNPDTIRDNKEAIDFVRSFFLSGKPVAAICHAPWILINAGVIKGRRVTSYSTIRADLQNAGAIWEDSEVVNDQALVTSRSPKDLDAFNSKLLEELREGKHELQRISA